MFFASIAFLQLYCQPKHKLQPYYGYWFVKNQADVLWMFTIFPVFLLYTLRYTQPYLFESVYSKCRQQLGSVRWPVWPKLQLCSHIQTCDRTVYAFQRWTRSSVHNFPLVLAQAFTIFVRNVIFQKNVSFNSFPLPDIFPAVIYANCILC